MGEIHSIVIFPLAYIPTIVNIKIHNVNYCWEMKEINLTQDKVAIVDDEDYERLNGYKWYYGDGYTLRRKTISKNNSVTWRMHWEVIGKPKKGFVTDHINGNGLDNRKCNLRMCTHAENMKNRKIARNNKSGYKGVSWCKKTNKWKATIMLGKQFTTIGYFSTAKDAGIAYNNVAVKSYKQFAKLNEI